MELFGNPGILLFLCFAQFLSGSGWWFGSTVADYCMGGNCFSTLGETMSTSNAVVIPATGKHTATVVFMHGLGDTGHGWSPVMQQIRAPHIKYVCPHAPIQPVSLNMGMRMPSWFDIKGLQANADQDEPGVKAAAKKVHEWIEEEIKGGIPSNRILLGGFSQGGALALYSTFTYDKPLAGIVALSSWLPLHDQIPGEHKENLEIPIFQAHGDADPLVMHSVGQISAQFIKAFNSHHTFKTYPGMPHSACDQEIQDMKQFVTQRLPPS